MRKDFNHKIREHNGFCDGTYKQQRIEMYNENAPSRESMKQWIKKAKFAYTSNDFCTKTNYRFILNWLRKQVGRNYNDVYSDIRRYCKSQQDHKYYLKRIKAQIDTTVTINEGKVCTVEGYELLSNSFYVDHNGQLQVYMRRKVIRPDVDVTEFKDKTKYFKKIDGIWYEWKINKTQNVLFSDYLAKMCVDFPGLKSLMISQREREDGIKVACSKKTLKKYQLKND